METTYFKLLSWKKIAKFRDDEIRFGFIPEEEMPHCYRIYFDNNGRKLARRYISGIGFQQKHSIMYLR